MDRLIVPQGEFELARHPPRRHETLRAWDAADEFVLHDLDEHPPQGQGQWVIVNGGSGALATALAAHRPIVVTDSYLEHVATTENLRRNELDPASVTLLGSLDVAPAPVALAVVKLPKSLALLEELLRGLRPSLGPASVIIGAGMTKHVHTSTIEVFERVIGPTVTTPARKKARLIRSTFDPDLVVEPSPWPVTLVESGSGATAVIHAGVFSATKLDQGTRLLLDHLPEPQGPGTVVDLGCGNGIVGITVAQGDPDAEVVFVDESFRAVASAEAGFRATFGDARSARFVVGDGLFRLSNGPAIERGSVDLVLNNPPFHDDHALSDATAWQMFTEAHGALRSEGELLVVGNRHLAYHAKIKRIFGNCEVVASNSKFVVFGAVRT